MDETTTSDLMGRLVTSIETLARANYRQGDIDNATRPTRMEVREAEENITAAESEARAVLAEVAHLLGQGEAPAVDPNSTDPDDLAEMRAAVATSTDPVVTYAWALGRRQGREDVAAEVARLRGLAVKLAAFVDREHEYTGSHCHPQPPEDCEDWCSACQMLRLVTDDVLAEARAENRRLGYDRADA